MESKTIDQLLATLRERGVQMWLDGQNLRYRSPAGVLTPDLLAQLNQQKTAIVEFLQNDGQGTTDQARLGPRSSSSKSPLSFAQERLWFLDQLEPGSAAYHVPLGLRLKGDLDVKALRAGLSEIVRRHEALRTRFEIIEGAPRQIIDPATLLELPLFDLSKLPELEREAEAKRLCIEEAQRPFDLAKGPVLRAKLIRLGTTEHIFSLMSHHIVSDGWSLAIFIRELKVLYQAFVAGQPSPLSELPIQYADYAQWQRDSLAGTALEKQMEYWKRQLAGAPSFLELPADRPRFVRPSYRGASVMFKLPKSLFFSLTELSRREGASLFMTLLAAFQTLLYRYTSQDDVVVGSAIAGRNRAEMENLIGIFVNTLVFRGNLSGNPSFRALLGRTREMALGAYANQELPFEKLVEALQPERDASRSPLFQVMLVLQNTPVETVRLTGLEAVPFFVDNGTTKFDLTLYINETSDSVKVIAEYNADLFDAARIERLIAHFQTLLEGIVANLETSLTDLPLLTRAERQQLLIAWNQTEVAYPQEHCLHELIEAQAINTPEAIALVFENQQLTNRELNQRANQLAHHLRKLGVGPDTLVAICVERSLEMVVGLLGILKAGGAYVPMDPEYPQDRLTFMLEDAQPKVLLTQKRWVDSLPTHQTQVVQLDADWASISQLPDTSAPGLATATNLAYIIYTSGSTGKPKGVEIPHQAVVNFLQSMRKEPGLKASDTLLAITTLSFDIAGLELWLPLTTGARIVIAKRETTFDGSALAALLETHKVTMMQATPSTWQILLSSGWKGQAGMKILCGGEPWSNELARQLLEKCESLWNLYGPTETTIWSAGSQVKAGQPVLIGRPIANTQLYILDKNLQPVPLGVPGELHIGGTGLARGYHNRPELTAEKFIANPFRSEAGARMYKTGDLCRYQADGNVEYLGRLDHQVKIRGFRIELGEIEAQLAAHPTVKEAVVIAREDTPGDKRLVAYLIAKNGEPPKATELRESLEAKLPDYMVPSAFVTLEKFPRTPNGKLDRKALPKPDAQKVGTGQTYVAPENYLEQVLCNLWREVLKVKRVGIKDNFFELGGHSLLAIRLINETNQSLKTNLNVPQFFNNPTVEQVARLLNEGKYAEPVPQLIALQPGRSEGAIYFLEAGMGLCRLAELIDTGPASFATLAPLPPGTSKAALLGQLDKLPHLEELAAIHARLIQNHNYPGPCILVGHSFAGLLAFEVAHQLQRAGRPVEMIFILDTWAISPPWWHHFRTLTPKRFIKSVSFRVGRLWNKAVAKSDSATKPVPAPGNSEQSSIAEDVNLPFGEAPWEILSMLYLKAKKHYRLRPLDSRALLFRAEESDLAHLYSFDPNMGWGKLFKGGLEVVDCSGDHFTLLKAPHIQYLVQKFQAATEKLNHVSKTH